MIPCSIGAPVWSRTVLDVMDGSGLNRVLLLVVRFRELILDVQFMVDCINLSALFLLGIVMV